MTAWRGFVLGVLLCGCGARTDDGGLPERAQPTSAPKPAQQPSTPASAPSATQAASPASFIQPVSPPPESSPPLAADPAWAPDAAPPPWQSEPPRPNPPPPPAANACFEYLGDWITCENAGWPDAEKTSASDVQSCMALCQQRPDCTAVTEYFWMDRPDLGCWLHLSSCNEPAGGVWQEEDGGRQYRKRCDAP